MNCTWPNPLTGRTSGNCRRIFRVGEPIGYSDCRPQKASMNDGRILCRRLPDDGRAYNVSANVPDQ